MLRIILCEPFTYFYLLLYGVVYVAALCAGRKDRSPTCVNVRGVRRQPVRLYRFENRVLIRRMEPSSDRARVQGLDASGLEVCARRFEEAIESVRQRSMGSRGTGQQVKPPSRRRS